MSQRKSQSSEDEADTAFLFLPTRKQPSNNHEGMQGNEMSITEGVYSST